MNHTSIFHINMIKEGDLFMAEGRNKLKPCPFCGGKARIVYKRSRTYTNAFGETKKTRLEGGYYTVGCETLDCILYYSVINNQPRLMFVASSKDIIIERWNRRPSEGE